MQTEDLEKIGLTKNESNVYHALLELGSINADPIIKKTGLHRNIVYDNLNKLIKKGLASYVIKNKRKYFETTQSRQMLEWLKQRKQEIIDQEKIAEKIIPEIETIRLSSKERKEAIIFSGQKSVINLALEMAEKGPVDMFATGYGMRTLFPIYYKRINNIFIQKKHSLRAIITKKMKDQDQGAAQCRWLPDHFQLPVNTSICKDKVNIFIWEKDPLAIQIRSKDVANSYRKYFEFMWKMAKK